MADNFSRSAILPWRMLSAMFRDPFVADAFRRAEYDRGGAFAAPSPCLPTLCGGAAAVPAGAPITGTPREPVMATGEAVR